MVYSLQYIWKIESKFLSWKPNLMINFSLKVLSKLAKQEDRGVWNARKEKECAALEKA